MDPRLEKAIKLINEFVSDRAVFVKLLELGHLLTISEARDLLEQISAALSDEVFNNLICRIEDREPDELLDDESELEPQALSLSDWDDEMVKEMTPYVIVLKTLHDLGGEASFEQITETIFSRQL